MARQLIARESPHSERGWLFYIDYVFILRLPSEAPPRRLGHRRKTFFPRGTACPINPIWAFSLTSGKRRLARKLLTVKHDRGFGVRHRPFFSDSYILASSGISIFAIFGDPLNIPLFGAIRFFFASEGEH